MPGAPRGQQTGLIDAVIIKHLALIGHSPYPYDKDFRDVRLLSKDVDTLVLALDLEGVHDVKLHHPSSSVATSN